MLNAESDMPSVLLPNVRPLDAYYLHCYGKMSSQDKGLLVCLDAEFATLT